MRFGKISLAAVAAASLLSAPVMAETASAAKSVGASKAKRVGAATNEENKAEGGTGIIIGIVAAAAIIGGIIIAAGNDDDGPTSP